MPRLCRAHATPDEVRRGRAGGGARAPPGKPLHPGSRGSCLLRPGNAVDPPTLLLGRGEGEAELLLQGTRKETAHRVPLPTHSARDFVDGRALGSLQHCDHRLLLRWGLRVGLLVGVGQCLHRRPQLIDQRVAVADLLTLLDIGQSVPQRQQPLAAELGCVQFLVRRDDNLALVHCGWGLAAEDNSVIANDIDAHGWGLLLRRHSADGDHTHALVGAQSHSFPDNLVALFGPIRAWHYSTGNARAAVSVLLYGAPADPSAGPALPVH